MILIKTLVKFFDKDTLKNILTAISLKPEKIVFVYDKEITDLNCFKCLKKCFKRHLKADFEIFPVDIHNIAKITDLVSVIVKNNDDCMLDITGGSELMMVGGHSACIKNGSPLVYTDIVAGNIYNITENKVIAKAKNLTLNDFIEVKGAEFIGNSHSEPKNNEYKNILKMAKFLFLNLEKWKTTCVFFQTITAGQKTELTYNTLNYIKHKNGRTYNLDQDLMNKFLELGFIKNLKFKKNKVEFTFESLRYKQYMTNFGIWLELFVYLTAKKIDDFEGVMLGAMIDWNIYDDVERHGNEIDIILSYGCMPVFISCKLKAPDVNALNELLVTKKRIGGWFSKCILVSFGDESNKSVALRAKELGITLLYKKDVLNDNFSKVLLEAIKCQNLLKLKWKNV